MTDVWDAVAELARDVGWENREGELATRIGLIARDSSRDGQRKAGEPLIYGQTGVSYYRDLFMSTTDKPEAAEAGVRLEHHRRQIEAISTETRGTPDGFEYRINPNLEKEHGLEFAPPLWLIEYFATARRPERIIQRLSHEFDLPPGCSSINLPRITQGTLVNDQTPGYLTDNQDVETKEVKAQTVQYSGESDWAIQALEQSPAGAHLDWAMFTDMSESLDASLEEDLISGKGEAFNEALGLLNITGINAISNTTATSEGIFTAMGEAMAKVGIERKRPPDAWLMGSARLAYLAFEKQKEQRPMILTDFQSDWPSAYAGGVAIYLDDAITRTLNTNQEPLFAVRADDFMLWHSPAKTMVYTDVLSGSLQVRFVLFRNTASMLHRYPSGISAITGTGMKPASGF